jgi:oligopeptide/dipeptide ABC transporter ATP-binding protein
MLLEIKNLKTYFDTDHGMVKAVDGINFTVEKQKTVGIVGESGSGKTVTAQSILQIMPWPGKIVDGQILFHKNDEIIDIAKLGNKSDAIRKIRGKEIAYIFQEPMSSLSPIHKIGDQITEAIRVHDKSLNKKEAKNHAIKLLNDVGMPNPEKTIDKYTFQLSGGMRQRAMIAMSLACNPKLLIADEPTTAIDVTIQAQILKLLKNLQEKFGMSILIITHDLSVIAEMADEVVVMYLGKIVENGSVYNIFDNPSHPYTKALLKSIPGASSEKYLKTIKGVVPDPFSIPKGCEFQPRCEFAIKGICEKSKPPVIEIEKGHYSRCFLHTEKRAETNNG